tara:strand:+ start:381 stop:521 length:141 start_codon:yes stop_codon:yes gene_type:complete
MKKETTKKETKIPKIEELKQQREQAKELFIKLSGAIEILELIEQEK